MTVELKPEFRPGHKSYQGNNVTTVFPIDFYFLGDDKNLRVYIVENATDAVQFLQLGADYTVAIKKGEGGNLTTLSELPIAPGFTLNIESNVEATQETTYKYGAKYPSTVVEFVLDKLTLLTQQLDDKSKLAIRQPDTESPLGSMILPPPNVRANTIMSFDADGKLVLPTSIDQSLLLVSEYWKGILPIDNQSDTLQELLHSFLHTWYVGKNGDDNNDGQNPQTPLKTITAALVFANTAASSVTPTTVVVIDSGEYGEGETGDLVLNPYVRLIAPHADRLNINFNLKDNSHLMSYRAPYSITKDQGEGTATCEITFYEPLLGATLLSKNTCTAGTLNFKIDKMNITQANLAYPVFNVDGAAIIFDIGEATLADYTMLFSGDNNSKIIGSVKSATSDANSVFVSANNGTKVSVTGNEIDMAAGYLYNIDDVGTLGTFVTIVANKVAGQRVAANGATANIVTASSAIVIDESKTYQAGQTAISHDLGEINGGNLVLWIRDSAFQRVNIGASFTLAVPSDTYLGTLTLETYNLYGGAVIDLSAYGTHTSGVYNPSVGAHNVFIIGKFYAITYLQIINF